jgi:hypothetical protein
MKIFNVETREVHSHLYRVKAENSGEAVKLVENYLGWAPKEETEHLVLDTDYVEFSHILESDTWTVEEDSYSDEEAFKKDIRLRGTQNGV